LNAEIPSSTIVIVNKKVSSAIERSASKDGSQGPYVHLTPEHVGKKATEFGITNTLRYYNNPKTFPDLPLLNVTSLWRLKNQYQSTINEQLKSGKSSGSSAKVLPSKPMVGSTMRKIDIFQ